MGLLLDVSNESLIAEGAATDIDITFTPKGAGNLQFDGLQWPNADGTANQVLQTDGGGVLSFVTAGGPTFLDSTFRVQDDGDNTKQIAFQASGITTATTRTITMPDQDVDLTPTTGTFQGSDAGLTDIAGLAVTDGNFIVADGANWVVESGSTVAQSIGGITQDLDTLGAPTADGEFIVATGAGAFAYETGATARASMGAGTLDNVVEDTTPQLGGALDVNGQIITSASNGDVTITPDGTGAVVLLTDFRIERFTTQTTDGTQTVIGSLDLVDDQSIFATLLAIGRENATGDTLCVEIKIGIRREGATTALVGEPIRTIINQTGSSSWDVDAVADDTGEQLDIRVTGQASHTIDWKVISYELTE
jgi:hypothetical protein